MDEDDDEEEKKQDSAEVVLHEFVYKLKNYFLESERASRVPGLLKMFFLKMIYHDLIQSLIQLTANIFNSSLGGSENFDKHACGEIRNCPVNIKVQGDP